MTESLVHPFYSDLPIRNSQEDQYDFTSVAQKIVQHLLTNAKPESYVIGVTGRWGSGKTSMLNLIEEQIKIQQTTDEPVIVFNFSPWRVLDRNTMLSNFLLLLIEKVYEEAESVELIKRKIGDTFDNVKKYALAIQRFNTRISPIVQELIEAGIPFVEKASDTVSKITKVLADDPSPPNIDDLYKKAHDTLLEIKIPIVVIIDDLDRLSPSEIIDTLTLVRSTAQLPYITFLTSYDPLKIEEAIEQKLNTNGLEYIEKFIQMQLSVPQAARSIIQTQTSKKIDEIMIINTRYRETIENWEFKFASEVVNQYIDLGAIKTPRDSYRLLNIINLNGIKQNSFNNFESFLKFSAIQLKYTKLFRWIEYVKWLDYSEYNNDSETYSTEMAKLEKILTSLDLPSNLGGEIQRIISEISD